MPFNTGISGLNAASADLKTIGNNIANAGTIGFKQSRAEFANLYAVSRTGTVSTSPGSGVRVSAIAQQFTQGNISFTENNLDVAVNGDGFYTLKDNSGATVYSRNGQFKVDKEGYVVTNDGYNLQGYQVDSATDEINTGDIGSLQLTTTQIEPQATTTTELFANVDASESIISAVIDPTTTSTYNHTTSYTTYDSLGNSMLTSMYFQKTADNAWTVGVRTVDGSGNPMPDDTAGPPVVQNTINYTLTFTTSGALETITDSGGTLVHDQSAASITAGTDIDHSKLDIIYDGASTTPVAGPPTGAADQTIALDIAGLTQYGANFGVNDLIQNGYTTGNLAGIEIDQSGIVQARFTNGESKLLGQIILTGFTNPQGLGQVGNNNWIQSFASGDPVVNIPGDGSMGTLTSGALEESNTELTEDLINLIIAQRNFQANAKTITTADTITQTIINI